MTDQPPLGSSNSIEIVVVDDMTAARFAVEEWESYPAVLATPHMLAAMERACASLLVPSLGEGQISVGARVELTHSAPTPIGSKVIARAKFIERDGPLYWFEIEAEDEGGTIGRGRHARAIVECQAVEDRAAGRRAGKTGMAE